MTVGGEGDRPQPRTFGCELQFVRYTVRVPPSWKESVEHTVLQHPLLETKPSLAGLRAGREARPETIFMGFGLCTQARLTRAVPMDILGMLLPGEALRRAAGARRIIVLIADRHAVMHHPADGVERCARYMQRVLERASSQLPLGTLEVWRASDFHDEPEFRRRLDHIDELASDEASAYLLRQVADVDYLQENVGPLLKLGWCLSGRRVHDVSNLYDERGFDAYVKPLAGKRPPFVYAKAGRTLNDRRKKAPPYVVAEPERRICLTPEEDPVSKLERVSKEVSRETYRGVKNHLAAIAKSYADLVPDAASELDERLEGLVRKLAA